MVSNIGPPPPPPPGQFRRAPPPPPESVRLQQLQLTAPQLSAPDDYGVHDYDGRIHRVYNFSQDYHREDIGARKGRGAKNTNNFIDYHGRNVQFCGGSTGWDERMERVGFGATMMGRGQRMLRLNSGEDILFA
ncbi:hypothetical protein ONS96_003870 [Cadophora gregata f. sp. sojae]|nr:hypothetical protein ONS96_003870 [Cadophora gregata f. sp. sojae]